MKNKLIYKIAIISLIAFSLTGCSVIKNNVSTAKDIESEKEDEKDSEKDAVKEEAKEESKPAEEKKTTLKLGAYVYEFEEEYVDGPVTVHYYLLFEDGGKGFYIAQDDVPMTWDDQKIVTENDSALTYTIVDEKKIEVIDREYKYMFEYVGEKLPDDVVDFMSHKLDGSLKYNNFPAADEFNYIITSDTINFYDVDGSVSYSGEGEELSEMKAAYYEMTENFYPILLISTPEAPHYVGYTHILQYLDEKVYNVLGLDDIRELWQNSGLVSATYTGGGYGETNYYYYGFNSDGEMLEMASKMVMEDPDYAKDYEANFGEKFVDMYYLSSDGVNRDEVTKEEFEKWLNEYTGGEAPMTELDWKPLDKVFNFNS